jgi:hypothetical protein
MVKNGMIAGGKLTKLTYATSELSRYDFGAADVVAGHIEP